MNRHRQGTVTENLLDYFHFLNIVRSEWVFKLHILQHLSEAIISSRALTSVQAKETLVQK